MNPEEYINNILKTENQDFNSMLDRLKISSTLRLLHSAMGMVDEAGEILKEIKKYIIYGQEINIVKLKAELGDLLWYTALTITILGTSFEEIMEMNIKKLKERYGDKFSEEKAINRDIQKEEEVLNKHDISQVEDTSVKNNDLDQQIIMYNHLIQDKETELGRNLTASERLNIFETILNKENKDDK